MNYRRKTPRHGRTARGISSDWSYPKIEKGSSEKSRANRKREAEKARASEKEYKMSQTYQIDVNGFRVRQCKSGEEVPCIRIKKGNEIWYVKSIKFLGETVIKQTEFDPDQPNKPFIWIETDGPIEYER